MSGWRADPIGVAIAVVLGALVGLRAVQVSSEYTGLGGWNSISAGGTVVGLAVTIVFVAALSIWRSHVSPDGRGWLRLAWFDFGMILGGLAGSIYFSGA